MADEDRVTRGYFKGKLKQINKAWKDSVVAKMEATGVTPAELMRKIGASKSAFTVMMRESSTVSRMVDAICEALDIPPPIISADEESSELIAMGRGPGRRGPRSGRRLHQPPRSSLA